MAHRMAVTALGISRMLQSCNSKHPKRLFRYGLKREHAPTPPHAEGSAGSQPTVALTSFQDPATFRRRRRHADEAIGPSE